MEANSVCTVLSIRSRAMLADAGLRPSPLHLIDISDLLSWVTRDKEHLLVHIERRIPSTSDRRRREMLNLGAILTGSDATISDILYLRDGCNLVE